jgi:hypothetical protein
MTEEHAVKVLKLTTGEEVIAKVNEQDDIYELIEAIQFRWGFEYDADVGRNVERLQPTPFPTNANLGRYEIDKEYVMVIASPRPEALGVYHSFVASLLNYNTSLPNPNSDPKA